MRKAGLTNGHVSAGISIRNGPLEAVDMDGSNGAVVNGAVKGKRKDRATVPNGKTYNSASSSEDDDQPLVSLHRKLFRRELLSLVTE